MREWMRERTAYLVEVGAFVLRVELVTSGLTEYWYPTVLINGLVAKTAYMHAGRSHFLNREDAMLEAQRLLKHLLDDASDRLQALESRTHEARRDAQ